MKIKTLKDFYKAIIHGPYAWPGGYPVYFLMADGEALAFETVKREMRNAIYAIINHEEKHWDGWRPVALIINYEDENLIDAHTGEKIESAYGENV